MRAGVASDRTERTISVEVFDGPVLDISQSWNVKVRKIQVDRLLITVINGETTQLRAFGGMRRVDGTTSPLQRGEYVWGGASISSSPDWAQLIWREAPAGVTIWRFREEASA